MLINRKMLKKDIHKKLLSLFTKAKSTRIIFNYPVLKYTYYE